MDALTSLLLGDAGLAFKGRLGLFSRPLQLLQDKHADGAGEGLALGGDKAFVNLVDEGEDGGAVCTDDALQGFLEFRLQGGEFGNDAGLLIVHGCFSVFRN